MINNIPIGTTIKYIGENLWIAKYNNEYSALGSTADFASKLLEYNIINNIKDIKIKINKHAMYKNK
jgi:hypothetical protein